MKKALGKLETQKSDALLLALEDNDGRIKRRTFSMFDSRKNLPANFQVAYTWRKLDAGGIDDLQEWVADHAKNEDGTSKNLLIGIDTYVKIASRYNDKSTLYRNDYDAMAPLTAFALQNSVAVISVMHNRKMGSNNPWDEISSSTGNV